MTTTTLTERFRQLIAANKIAIFIKGTKQLPRCGFSAQVLAILSSTGKPFEAVNVLEDFNQLDNVRSALSEIVEEQTGGPWRTTPQVFVGGQFVGGCDILTEMHEAGELQPLIDKAFAG